jgi:hypothetical protein
MISPTAGFGTNLPVARGDLSGINEGNNLPFCGLRRELKLFLAVESKTRQTRCNSQDSILSLVGQHAHSNALLCILVADLDLDQLPAAVGNTHHVLNDIWINGLSFRVALEREAGLAGRPHMASAQIIRRWDIALSRRKLAEQRQNNGPEESGAEGRLARYLHVHILVEVNIISIWR